MDTLKKSSTLQPENGKISIGNLLFYYIESAAPFQIEHLVGFDALIIDAAEPDFTHRIMRKIRGHYNPEFYLKPIFLINYRATRDAIVSELHDGILYSFDQLPEIAGKVRAFFMLSTQLETTQPNSFEAQIFKRTLNFMFTRGRKTLTPIIDPNSVIGNTYPELSVNFDREEGAQVLDILDWAEKEGFIWPDFHDKIYLCNNCNGGLLSYREVCPHCNSAHIESQDLIHHFHCAFIAPLSEFRNSIDGTMTCPKCNKQLRHIGVDYDKPSVINKCNNCSSSFQDMFVKAKCFNCEQDMDVQYLISKNLYVYKFTKKGRSVAVNGLFTAREEYNEIFGTVSPATMRIMLHYDFERQRRVANLQVNIVAMYYENLHELNTRIGKKARRILLADIVQLVRENINPQDYLSFDGSNMMFIALHDVTIAEAQKICDTLDERLETALGKNFSGYEPSVRSKISAMNSTDPINLQLERLTKSLYE
jgi:GGDEF domain-containing protein